VRTKRNRVATRSNVAYARLHWPAECSGSLLSKLRDPGYCLEMICADFLAGVSLETGNPDALLSALTRLVLRLPLPREQLLESVQVVP
jgi:hypothetical protein